MVIDDNQWQHSPPGACNAHVFVLFKKKRRLRELNGTATHENRHGRSELRKRVHQCNKHAVQLNNAAKYNTTKDRKVLREAQMATRTEWTRPRGR